MPVKENNNNKCLESFYTITSMMSIDFSKALTVYRNRLLDSLFLSRSILMDRLLQSLIRIDWRPFKLSGLQTECQKHNLPGGGKDEQRFLQHHLQYTISSKDSLYGNIIKN